MIVQAGEVFRFEQEVYFDGHLYGVDESYPYGGEIEIRRGADGFYYNGLDFQETFFVLPTVVDASGTFHYYDFTIPVISINGDTYNIKIGITSDTDSQTLGTLLVRPASTGGGGGGGGVAVFDAVGFVTGFGTTVGES